MFKFENTVMANWVQDPIGYAFSHIGNEFYLGLVGVSMLVPDVILLPLYLIGLPILG